jgi:hypothetical protein
MNHWYNREDNMPEPIAQNYIQIQNLFGQRLAILKDAYNITITVETNTWPILKFSLPKKSYGWAYVKNEHRVFYRGEYYIIKTSGANMDSKGLITQDVDCPSIASDLNHKYNQIIGSYGGDNNTELLPTTQNPVGIMTIALANTGWTIGTITVANTMYRTFSGEWQTAVQTLADIAEKFSAFIVYHPNTLTVDLLVEPGQPWGHYPILKESIRTFERYRLNGILY